MAYYQFQTEDGELYGSFETFQDEGAWYWWPCYPGCLPDDDAQGPFKTEAEAIENANADA